MKCCAIDKPANIPIYRAVESAKDNPVKLDTVIKSYLLPLWPQKYLFLMADGSELLHITYTRVRVHIDTLIGCSLKTPPNTIAEQVYTSGAEAPLEILSDICNA